MEQDDLQGFEKFLSEEKQLGKRTVAMYIFYYKHFNPLKLSQDYVHDFILKHKNTSIVRAFIMNYLTYHDIPLENIQLPKKSKGGNKVKRLIRPISHKEIDILRKYLYSKSFKEGLIFDLIYQGALRRVEATTIKVSSFKWDEWLKDMSKFCKLIILGKGNKERIVLINPETTLEILKHYIKTYNLESEPEIIAFITEHKESLLFSKEGGKPLTEANIYCIIKRGSIKVLGRDVRPHELRHERSSELERKGVSIKDIKNYLGHSRIATTELYLHRTGEESLESIEEKLKKS